MVTSEADFVIAVVGPRLVGKSTVIRRGLKRPDQKPVVVLQDDRENRVTTCISHFNIGGQLRSVEVLEIDMALLKYNSAGVIWPEELPKCEGAMLWYGDLTVIRIQADGSVIVMMRLILEHSIRYLYSYKLSGLVDLIFLSLFLLRKLLPTTH